MGIFALTVLAFGMSMDAFAVTLVRGASTQKRTSFWQILRMGLIFGVVEMITPLIGFALGVAASNVISQWDHWLAFILLTGLGGHMIYEGFQAVDEEAEVENSKTKGFILLLTTAFATSIDSMIVGVGLAFLDVNIVIAALMIGIATTMMSILGLYLGRSFGSKLGKLAEILGGMILIMIGAIVLVEHLGLLD